MMAALVLMINRDVKGTMADATAPAMPRNDLRPLQDAVRVLRNPHKGWYWHYIDNGYGRINYRDPKIHPPGDYVRDFPGLNHLYLRIDWSDIEARKDVFDWSYVDAIMKEWGTQGYRFAFRVCCYEGDPALPYATPEWLCEMGCAGTDVAFDGHRAPPAEKTDREAAVPPGASRDPSSGGPAAPPAAKTAWEPDYGDPLFLERLEVFVRQFAARFDGHPLVEYVDVGSYGTWGEGYTWRGSEREWPLDILKRHVDIENHHFHDIKPEVWQDGGPFLAALERTRATYAGFHG